MQQRLERADKARGGSNSPTSTHGRVETKTPDKASSPKAQPKSKSRPQPQPRTESQIQSQSSVRPPPQGLDRSLGLVRTRVHAIEAHAQLGVREATRIVHW